MLRSILLSLVIFSLNFNTYAKLNTSTSPLVLPNSQNLKSKISILISPNTNIFNQKNMKTRFFSRQKSEMNLWPKKRTQYFPTQLIRFKMNLKVANLKCDYAVFDEFANIFLGALLDKDVGYRYWLSCSPVDNEFSADFSMDAYSDEGIENLQKVIADYNETEFHGVPIEIEPVKGIVLSLDLYAGLLNEHVEWPEIEKQLYHSSNKYYFNSLYGMDETLMQDLSSQLMTLDPQLINSFFEQWMRHDTADDFLEMLKISNAVYITIEPIYLMDKKPKAYAPFSYGVGIDCTDSPSERCLG